MNEKNWHKFPLLFSLYIAQSIPMSFFSTVVPVIMRQENYSLSSIGLLQLIKLPWTLKFLWAPMVDNKARTTKDLKRLIFISEAFYALVILCIAFFDLQTDFKLIIFLVIIAFIASGTQDIAVDIYAILSLKPSERSLGNSMQSGGSFIGSFFGTGVLLVAYHYFGWSNVLILLAVFVFLAVLPLFFSRKEIPLENIKRSCFTQRHSFVFQPERKVETNSDINFLLFRHYRYHGNAQTLFGRFGLRYKTNSVYVGDIRDVNSSVFHFVRRISHEENRTPHGAFYISDNKFDCRNIFPHYFRHRTFGNSFIHWSWAGLVRLRIVNGRNLHHFHGFGSQRTRRHGFHHSNCYHAYRKFVGGDFEWKNCPRIWLQRLV